MPLEELVEFLQEKCKNRFAEPEEIAKYLKQLARNSYRLDKEIERMVKGISQTLTSVKGIDPVYATGLIAEIRDIHRFDNHHALAKYAGLVWKQYQSGEYEAENTSRMQTENKYLRYYLVQASDAIRKHDTEYKAFYQK